jgi:hypothetical protein
MGYIIFLVCLILEYCPASGWNWDFGFYWILILFLLVVQVALDVTRVQGKASKEGGTK